MIKDTKDDRLSFRITDQINEMIDVYVNRYDNIKDRSDFGNKAINSFIDYLQYENETIDLISISLKKLAKIVGVDKLETIKDLDLLINNQK